MAQAIRSLVMGSDGRYRVSIVDAQTGLPVEDLASYGGNITGGSAPLPVVGAQGGPAALQTDTGTVEEQVAQPLQERSRYEMIQQGGGEGMNRQPSTPVADNAYNADGTPNRMGARVAGMATGMVGGTVGMVAGGLVGGPIGAAAGGLLGRQLASNSRLGDKLSPNGQLYGWGVGQPKAEAVIAEIDKENAAKAPAQSGIRSSSATRLNEAPSTNPMSAGSSRSSVPSFDELSAAVGTTQDGPVSVAGRASVSVPNTDSRPTLDGQPVTQRDLNPTFTRDQTTNVQQGMRGLVSSADRTGMNPGIRGVLDAVDRAVPGAGINSGYRSPEHNAKVGGARNSQHTHGNAADISLKGMTDEQKVATLEASIQADARGLGIYNGGTTLHADTRQGFATWGPSPGQVPTDPEGQRRGSTFSEVSINDQPGWAQPSLRAALGAGTSQVHSYYGPEPTSRASALAANEQEQAGKTGSFADQVTGYMSHARQAESGGDDTAVNNTPGASAAGRYGFTSGTWADVGRRYPELGLTAANRMDPEMQDRAMRAFTEDNAASLRSLGIDTTNANLYSAHHLGIAGARSVLTSPDDTKLSSVLSGLAMKQNPHLRDMTVADFKAFAEKKAPSTPVDETQKALEEGSTRPASQPAKTTAERAAEPEDRRQHDPDKSATEMARALNEDAKQQKAAPTAPQQTKASTAGLGTAAFNSLSFSGGLIGATADKTSAKDKSEADSKESESKDTSKDSISEGGSKSSGGKGGSDSSDKGNQNTSSGKSKDSGKGLGSSSKSKDNDNDNSSSGGKSSGGGKKK